MITQELKFLPNNCSSISASGCHFQKWSCPVWCFCHRWCPAGITLMAAIHPSHSKFRRLFSGKFPCGPMAGTPCRHCRARGPDPGQRTKIPHTVGRSQKKNQHSARVRNPSRYLIIIIFTTGICDQWSLVLLLQLFGHILAIKHF